MKNFLVIAFLVFSFNFTNAQEFVTIIDRNIEARGGREVLKNLHSLIADVKLESDKGVIDGKIYILDQTAYRLEMQIMGETNYFLVTPELGEMFFPVQGQKEPMLMTEDQYMMMRPMLDITGPFFNFEQKDGQIDYLGQEKIDQQPTAVLQSFENGIPEPIKNYFSLENYQLIKTIKRTETQEGLVDFVTDYSDFTTDKKSGYVYPAVIKNNLGTTVIKKINVNPEIPEELLVLSKDKDKRKKEDTDSNGNKLDGSGKREVIIGE